MKKIIAIFILLQVVSNNAFAEELVKLPRLFTHFYHHANEHNDTDFFEFLHLHYSDHHKNDAHDDHKHTEEDNDCNLPFKHCGNCCVDIHVPAVCFVSHSLSADYNVVTTTKSIFIPQDDRIETLDIGNIWQPPKIS